MTFFAAYQISVNNVSAGIEIWKFETDDWVFSSPTIADVNGDGSLDIVFGNGVHASFPGGGQIYAIDSQGNELWNYTALDDVQSSAVVIDLDGDGFKEVLIGSDDGNLYCLNGTNGEKLWNYYASQEIKRAVSVEDINDDGEYEILFSGGNTLYVLNSTGDFLWNYAGKDDSAPTISDLDNDGNLEVITADSDTIFALDGDGNPLWQVDVGWYITTSPAVGDINGDGILDLAVGCYDDYVYAINGSGSLLWKSSILGGSIDDSSPAIADIDKDGKNEIVIGTNGGDGEVYLINSSGSIIWSVDLGNNIYSSPALADMNNDGYLDIIIGSWAGSGLYIIDRFGSIIDSYPMVYQVASSPAIADINEDGYLEIIITSTNGNEEKGALHVLQTGAVCNKKEIKWRMFQHDNWHTGNLDVYNSWRLPTVMSHLPKTNAMNIHTKTNIRVVFSQTMNTTSVQEAFSYTNGTASWNSSHGSFSWITQVVVNDTFIFDPFDDFIPNSTIEVRINGTAKDIYNNSLDGNYNRIVEDPITDRYAWNFTIGLYEISLIIGWNLISTPLIQIEQDLTEVLGSIDGWYDAVQWYDITDPADPWKHDKIGKPLGNDLSMLNETMSFWIHITNPGDIIFVYNGTQPTSNQTIQLYKGWNMVGYPSLTSHNRTVGLNNLTFDTHVDAIQWYDAATKTWHFMDQDDLFVPGRGYWIHSKVETMWEVPL